MYQNFFLKQKKKKKKKNTPSCCHKEILPSPFLSSHFKKVNNEEHRKRKWTTYAQLRA